MEGCANTETAQVNTAHSSNPMSFVCLFMIFSSRPRRMYLFSARLCALPNSLRGLRAQVHDILQLRVDLQRGVELFDSLGRLLQIRQIDIALHGVGPSVLGIECLD